jgi:hypothetical protein
MPKGSLSPELFSFEFYQRRGLKAAFWFAKLEVATKNQKPDAVGPTSVARFAAKTLKLKTRN